MRVIFTGPQPSRTIAVGRSKQIEAEHGKPVEVPDHIGESLVLQRYWAEDGSKEPDASTAASRLADAKNVDLASIEGSGEDGRITVEDVRAAIGEEPEPEQDPDATDAAIKLAEENGIEISDVQGSGEDGRVSVSDVRSHLEGRVGGPEGDNDQASQDAETQEG